jgi:hypothetical protein
MKTSTGFVRWTTVTLLVLLAGAAVAVKASQNEGRRARIAERNLRAESMLVLGKEVMERVRMAHRQRISIDEFEERFGPLTPLTDRREPRLEDKTHIFVDEASQRSFYLRFEDGTLMGYTSSHGTDDIDPGVVIETHEYLRSESIRRCLLSWCLVLAAVCTTCWFLNPGYAPTWQGITSNDNLVWAVVLIVVSAGFGYVNLRGAGESVKTFPPASGKQTHTKAGRTDNWGIFSCMVQKNPTSW